MTKPETVLGRAIETLELQELAHRHRDRSQPDGQRSPSAHRIAYSREP